MTSNFDFYDPNGQKAVLYAASARNGRRVEIGLQVYNHMTASWCKRLFTQLLPQDTEGLAFELFRLVEKAIDAGYRPLVGRSVAYHLREAGKMVDELDELTVGAGH